MKRPFFLALLLGCLSAHAGHLGRITVFTTLHSARIDAAFDTLPGTDAVFRVLLMDDRTGKLIVDRKITGTANGNTLQFHLDGLDVDAWTPLNPHLYRIALGFAQPGQATQQQEKRIGFRLFESRNGHLYLNGHPIFLRGIAINPPDRGIPDSIEKSRRFAEQYVDFMKSIHVNIIRIPSNETWYDVCDEKGMMVFGGNYSGTVDGQKPPKDYEKAIRWYEDKTFAMIASHPSLMVYAMTNETPFAGKTVAEWEKFLSFAATRLRRWDSTRVYIANAGYGYGKAGDICDLHRYWGWYYSSPFTFLHIRNDADIIPFPKKPGQPITFTECVGNYSGPDGRYNLTPNHKNPGSQLNWTGHAPNDLQARLANEHQCFTFKQATELNRRLRDVNGELSGVFPFTILFYNWNTVHDFVDMGPKPVTAQARISYSPVLVSWENWTTQLYSGATFKPVLHIVNDADDFSDLKQASFVYRLIDDAQTILLTDSFRLPDITYYGELSKPLSITLPANLPMGHYQLLGQIFRNGRLIASNEDRLFIAGKTYGASAVKPQRTILLYENGDGTASGLLQLSIPFHKISSFDHLSPRDAVVIGENSADGNLVSQAPAIKRFIAAGGRLVCLRQDSTLLPNLNAVLPCPIRNITMDLDYSQYPPPPRPSRNGYCVNRERPGDPVFDGIDREDLKVWSDYTGWTESEKTGFPALYPVTDGFVPEDKKDMAKIGVLADYGPGLEGMAIAEFFDGKGSILLCGMDLIRRKGLDPVADRLLGNLIGYMGNTTAHDPAVLVTAPIVWGDYGSEKGLLTGINSGLLLNSRPRVMGTRRTNIVVTKEGHEFAGGERSGFNTRPGIQYVPYGRRPWGPYIFRGFGDVPAPLDDNNNIGEGSFYCTVPPGRTRSTTLVWNPADVPLQITITVNGRETTSTIQPDQRASIEAPVDRTRITMRFRGDRRLVLLETDFQ
jgi:beta-galactosidase